MAVRPAPSVVWLGEPLVQFAIAGAILFAASQWWGGDRAGVDRIVVSAGRIETIGAGFARAWRRPPSEEELKALLDDHVREEIATREAMAMGLDREDTIIRRRLRQKFEFLSEDLVDLAPPTETDLQRWLDSRADAFRSEPRISFRQVSLDPARRGASVDADARALLDTLAAAGADADIDALGDGRMLPAELPATPREQIARQFGDGFANALMEAPVGRWSGPVRSAFGLHVVLVRSREEGRVRPLAEVRAQVEREVSEARRRAQLDAVYAKLLEKKYRVVIEARPAPAATGPSK